MAEVTDWTVESSRVFASGEVTCLCGRTFMLWWNGGELDEHQCDCGRHYRTEHRETVLVVRRNAETPRQPEG